MAKFCINCGKELEEGAKVCSECKQPVEEEAPVEEVKAPEKVETVEVVNTTPAAPKKGNGMAIAGLVISLVSLILCCGGFSWLALIFSIIGLVKAKDVEGKGKGMAIAGLIISIVGMILAIIVTVMFTISGSEIINEANSYNSDWDSSSYYGY